MRTLVAGGGLLGYSGERGHAEAGPMPGPAVVVRFYKVAVPAEEFSAARRLAAGILDAPASPCRGPDAGSEAGPRLRAACQRPPTERVILHIGCRDGRQCAGPSAFARVLNYRPRDGDGNRCQRLCGSGCGAARRGVTRIAWPAGAGDRP